MILALESSTPWLSMGLFEEQKVLFQVTHYTKMGHSQSIFQYLEVLLREFHFHSHLEAVVVGLGPGFFTGVKIASIIGKGIAYAWEKPLYGFSTLEVLAKSVPEQEAVHYEFLVPVILHKKQELFWMTLPPNFSSFNVPYHIHVGSCEELFRTLSQRRILFVTPWKELKEYFTSQGFACAHPSHALPEARHLAGLYFLRRDSLSLEWEDLFRLVPFYGSKLFET